MTINENNKKNILLLMPTIQRGGIENNLVYLTEFFIKKNYNCYLLTSNISREIKAKLNNKLKIVKPINYLKFNFKNSRYNDAINCFIGLFKFKNIENLKILSFQNHFLSVIGSKFIKKKIILRIANHPTGAVKFFQKKINYEFKLFLKNTIYRFADAIICNSNETKNYFKDKKFNNRLLCIYNPVKFITSREKFNKKKDFFLTVGRLEKQKNVFGIILAFEKIIKIYPNFKLVVIGNGSQEKILKNYVLKKKLKKNVKFINFQNPNKYLKRCKALILNSLFEGLPNILLEAQKFNAPIISTSCSSGPKEILKNGKFGILTPVNNVNKLYTNILKLNENYNFYFKKTFDAKKNLSRFNFENQCNKYLKLITKI